MMTITVQTAVAEGDRDLAFRVREQVFVDEQHVPREDEYDEHDDAAHHYLAWADGQPVGAARWRPTEKGVKLERFAVLAPYRSKGVGGVLLRQVMADALAAHPDASLYLHAQVQAQRFYQRHGFLPEGELFYECEIPHYRMRLAKS
jgi:predicted GNAT family N-acyltransferase